ncbi:epimerase [Streptomyces sp. L7]
MRVAIFGASGMVGQGVLRACLLEQSVDQVLLVVRTSLNVEDPKVREVVHTDFGDFTAIQGELEGLDACFFLPGHLLVRPRRGGVHPDYARLHAGRRPSREREQPRTDLHLCVGEGTDSTESGRSMWARVKGRTENELLAMPFHAYTVPARLYPARATAPSPGQPPIAWRTGSHRGSIPYCTDWPPDT